MEEGVGGGLGLPVMAAEKGVEGGAGKGQGGMAGGWRGWGREEEERGEEGKTEELRVKVGEAKE